MKRRLRKSVVRTLKFTLAMMMLFTTVNNIPMTVIADDFAEETTDVLPTEEPTTVESSEPAVEPQPEVVPEEPVVEETPVVEEVPTPEVVAPTPEVIPSVEPTVVPTETPEVEPTVAPTATPVVETTDDKLLDEEDEVVATVVPTTEPVVIETPEVKVEDTLTYDFGFETQDIMEPTKGFVGDVVKVAENTLVREGYNFLYWYVLNEDGTETIYNANDEYTLTDKDDVLTAKWEEVVVEEPVETEVTETEETTPVRPMMLANPNEEEKEYPEHMIYEEYVDNKSYPGIVKISHLPDYENCENRWEGMDGGEETRPCNHHYVSLEFKGKDTITYIRCDIYKSMVNPPEPSEVTYRVDFVNGPNGESKVIYVNENKAPAKGDVPSWGEGYWAYENGTIVNDPSEVKIKKDTTFVWNEKVVKEFVLTYDSNYDGSTETDITRKYNENAEVTVEDNTFKNEGYEFKGWNTRPDGNGTDYSVGKKFEIKEDLTLYAKWEQIEPQKPQNLQDVYIYAQITGNVSSGGQLNKDGWYTIGKTKLDIPVKPNQVGDGNNIIPNHITADAAKKGLINKYFEPYQHNNVITPELLLEKMTSINVVAEEQGATDYVENERTWHMDIRINYEDIQEKLHTLTYQDGVNNSVFAPISEKVLEGSKVGQHDFNSSIDGIQNPVREGYTFKGWKDQDGTVVNLVNGNYVMPNQDVTLTAQWQKDETLWHKVTFKAGENGSLVGNTTFENILNGTAWEEAITEPTYTADYGYKFAGWYENGNLVSEFPTEITASHEYEVRFDKDETQTQPTNYFVNYSQDGVLVEQDSYEVKSTAWVNDYPAMITVEDIDAANNRYVGYKVDPNNKIPPVGTLVESGTTITVNYIKDVSQQKPFSYTVNHIVDGGTRDTDTVTTSVWVNDEDLTVLDVKDMNYRTYEGYVVDTTATVIPETIAVGGVINVYYEADATGTDPNNPTTPDGTPDKYQVMIDYNAVNGTVSPDFFYVTLTKDGKYASAEDGGSYVLTAEDLPTASANAGYQNGTWDVTPVEGMAITKDTVFTVTYTATPTAPVTSPVNPNPQPTEPVFTCPEGTVWNEATGMCEVIPAPAVAPVVPVGPADDDADVEPVEPDQEIVEVEDEDTPQTGGDVEIIEDDVTPEVGAKGSWALINLIATVLGAVLAVILLLSKHDKIEEDEEDPEAAEVEYTRRRKWKVISTVVAILSIVVFFLTENMRLPMVWVDKWTLVMVLFFLVNAVSLYMGRRFHEVEDEEESTNA